MQLQTGPEKQHPHNVVTRVTANRYKEMITTVHIVTMQSFTDLWRSHHAVTERNVRSTYD